MKMTVDRELCIGSGECVFAAPEVFDQDDDGFVIVLTESPDAHAEQVLAAAHACPAKVIQVQ
jgi:ferredoxin